LRAAGLKAGLQFVILEGISMKTGGLAKLCAAVGLLLSLTMTAGFAQEADMIQPGTPEATKVMVTLKHRERHDRDQAQSYTDGADSDRGLFYARKADEIKALLDKLQQGQAISRDDVHHAMSNKHAERYGDD
jgi:hypothetical protein